MEPHIALAWSILASILVVDAIGYLYVLQLRRARAASLFS